MWSCASGRLFCFSSRIRHTIVCQVSGVQTCALPICLGVRTWRRGQARAGENALDRLSDREREIATLIGAGHSNPEIASRLFLSRKTVERHVSNILARTGARNRTELARHLNVSETRPASR